MIAPLTRTEAANQDVGHAQAVAKRHAAKKQKTLDSATKSSAEKDKDNKSFIPGDLVKCIEATPNNWPLALEKIYMVAVDVIAGFSHKGPTNGVILDPCPSRHGVSNGPMHPYVWDNERFVFFSHPKATNKTFVPAVMSTPTEPYGFD